MSEPSIYYRDDLARIHHLGFGFHAERCAPGILAALTPVRKRNGLVVELGCGSGHLTRLLLDAGHRVIASDASTSMLAIARENAAGAEDIRQLILPDDPLPEADAIVAIGHILNYLEDEAAIERALIRAAGALRPSGILALDIQNFDWARTFLEAKDQVRVADDWVLISQFSVPEPGRFIRRHISFTRDTDSSWRRDEEVHRNVLIDTEAIPALLARVGVRARIGKAFGEEELPQGLVTIIGEKIA
jgi:SAM-dependent methyltransferase